MNDSVKPGWRRGSCSRRTCLEVWLDETSAILLLVFLPFRRKHSAIKKNKQRPWRNIPSRNQYQSISHLDVLSRNGPSFWEFTYIWDKNTVSQKVMHSLFYCHSFELSLTNRYQRSIISWVVTAPPLPQVTSSQLFPCLAYSVNWPQFKGVSCSWKQEMTRLENTRWVAKQERHEGQWIELFTGPDSSSRMVCDQGGRQEH
jgi:hypothetical protein